MGTRWVLRNVILPPEFRILGRCDWDLVTSK